MGSRPGGPGGPGVLEILEILEVLEVLDILEVLEILETLVKILVKTCSNRVVYLQFPIWGEELQGGFLERLICFPGSFRSTFRRAF